MDIDQFYDGDPRRRGSEEVSFGEDWLDGDGDRWSVAWLRETGELFAMLRPAWTLSNSNPILTGIPAAGRISAHDLTIFVLAVIQEADRVKDLAGDWETQQGRPESFEWLVKRLHAAGHPPNWSQDVPEERRPKSLWAWYRTHFID